MNSSTGSQSHRDHNQDHDHDTRNEEDGGRESGKSGRSVTDLMGREEEVNEMLGAIELMVLVAVDNCISVKLKWMETMEALAKAATRLKLIPRDTKITVVAETIEAEKLSIVDYSNLSKDFIEIEDDLLLKSSVLNQTLNKYGLVEELLSGQAILSWRDVSFTKLKRDLIEYFSKRTTPLQVKQDRIKVSLRNVSVPLADSAIISIQEVRRFHSASSIELQPEPKLELNKRRNILSTAVSQDILASQVKENASNVTINLSSDNSNMTGYSSGSMLKIAPTTVARDDVMSPLVHKQYVFDDLLFPEKFSLGSPRTPTTPLSRTSSGFGALLIPQPSPKHVIHRASIK